MTERTATAGLILVVGTDVVRTTNSAWPGTDWAGELVVKDAWVMMPQPAQPGGLGWTDGD